jgi:hypothetical protein
MGFEPMTSSLPRKCSTPELRRLIDFEFRMFNFGFIIPDKTTYILILNYQIRNRNSEIRHLNERKTRFELATYSLEGYRSTN